MPNGKEMMERLNKMADEMSRFKPSSLSEMEQVSLKRILSYSHSILRDLIWLQREREGNDA